MTDDYDVISYLEGGQEWSLDDVGISRNSAIAAMFLRAYRFADWDAVGLIEDVMSGAHDPEVPYWINDSAGAWDRRVDYHAACFRIIPSIGLGELDSLPAPDPDTCEEFQQRRVDAMRAVRAAAKAAPAAGS